MNKVNNKLLLGLTFMLMAAALIGIGTSLTRVEPYIGFTGSLMGCVGVLLIMNWEIDSKLTVVQAEPVKKKKV